MKIIKSKKNVRNRGTATLETALVMILLISISLGIMGIGWFFLRVQQVTNAARHGARVAIRYGATNQDVEDAVDYCLNPVGLEYEQPPAITYEYGTDPNIGDAVTVTVTGKQLDMLNLGSMPLVGIPGFSKLNNYTASVTMAKEGP